MSLSLGALLGLGAASGGIQSGMNLGNEILGTWATNSARESLNKNITKTNLKVQKQYDLWTQEQDKLYEQWYQNYLYSLQNNEYYNLARKYAQNTASWAVEGLKKAGLNPVLAGIDSNLSSSMGNASPQGSGRHTKSGVPSGSAPSAAGAAANVNLASSIQSFSAADQARVDTKIKEQTAPSVIKTSEMEPVQMRANTAQSLAQAKLIDAQADKVRTETEQLRLNRGNPNNGAMFYRGRDELESRVKDVKDTVKPIMEPVKEVIKDTYRGIMQVFPHEDSKAPTFGKDFVDRHPAVKQRLEEEQRKIDRDREERAKRLLEHYRREYLGK